MSAKRIVLIDNYDSFTYNLAHLFGAVGARVDVVRNDDARLDSALIAGADGVCIGPGPGRPGGAGKTLDVVAWSLAASRPLLGVCLGLQAIGQYFGLRRLRRPATTRYAWRPHCRRFCARRLPAKTASCRA